MLHNIIKYYNKVQALIFRWYSIYPKRQHYYQEQVLDRHFYIYCIFCTFILFVLIVLSFCLCVCRFCIFFHLVLYVSNLNISMHIHLHMLCKCKFFKFFFYFNQFTRFFMRASFLPPDLAGLVLVASRPLPVPPDCLQHLKCCPTQMVILVLM